MKAQPMSTGDHAWLLVRSHADRIVTALRRCRIAEVRESARGTLVDVVCLDTRSRITVVPADLAPLSAVQEASA